MTYLSVYIFTIIILMLNIKLSNKYNVFLDQPNNRSSHKDLTPRNGGIGLIITTYFYLFTQLPFESLFVGFVMFIIGLIDDYKEVSNKIKLLLIFIFIGLIIPMENIFLIMCFTIIISSIMISFNFIDGLNGISSSLSITTLLFMTFIYFFNNDPLFESTLLITAALFGFLTLNITGKIFMGDSGTMFIGFLLGYLSLDMYQKEYLDLFQMVFIHGLYIIDLIVIIFFRTCILKKSPFSADRNHLHHILYDSKKGSLIQTLPILILVHILILSIIMIPGA